MAISPGITTEPLSINIGTKISFLDLMENLRTVLFANLAQSILNRRIASGT
jgi:hypothetical protein